MVFPCQAGTLIDCECIIAIMGGKLEVDTVISELLHVEQHAAVVGLDREPGVA